VNRLETKAAHKLSPLRNPFVPGRILRSSNKITFEPVTKILMQVRFGYLGVFLLTLSLITCTPIYKLNHKQQIVEDEKAIEELTQLVNQEDITRFLSKLTIRNDCVYHDLDILGFGYIRSYDQRCLNNRVCFTTKTVSKYDSTISLIVSPYLVSVPRIIASHYELLYRKYGWKLKEKVWFYSKNLHYTASTRPIGIVDTALKFRNPAYDSIMSPLYNYTYKVFDEIKQSLNETELLLFLHSLDPMVRIRAMRFIKCNKIKVSPEIQEWINTVQAESPPIFTFVRSEHWKYKTIDYFLDCGFENPEKSK
jgi:hypothetical protein